MATTVTLKSNAIDISGSTSGTTTLQATAVAGTTTITLPAATDTLVGKATTDTLTNKTLTGAVMNGTVGATTPSTGSFTSLAYSTTLTGGTGIVNLGSGQFYKDASGNVGIGTSSPSSYGLLSVVSSTAGSAKISIQDTSAGTALPLLQFGMNDSSGFNSSDAVRIWSSGVSATVASLNFAAYNAAAPSTAQMILSAGRLIIGGVNINGRVQSQTPATYTESNFRSDSATASGTGWNHFYGTSSSNTVANIIIYGNGNIQNANNSYGALSDVKLKDNIVDATPKLADLMQVKIRNYNLKSDNGTNKQIGVIAQELESIFPGMVETNINRDIDNNEIGTTKSVKYSVFVPMLIKAMQEQQALITSLTTRIAALEAA
jgi:hypothetical protein